MCDVLYLCIKERMKLAMCAIDLSEVFPYIHRRKYTLWSALSTSEKLPIYDRAFSVRLTLPCYGKKFILIANRQSCPEAFFRGKPTNMLVTSLSYANCWLLHTRCRRVALRTALHYPNSCGLVIPHRCSCERYQH